MPDKLSTDELEGLRVSEAIRRGVLAERNELRAILDSHRVCISNAQLPVWVCEAEVERHERRFRETEAEWVDRFQALEAEVEQLRSLKAGTVTVELANGLFGSDKYVPEQRARGLEAEIERLRAALEGVIAEADRKTAAFDRAHAALARHKK